MSTPRLHQLLANCGRAREMIGTGEVMDRMTAGRLDPSDMYRSAWVQAVAALDTYVRGIMLDRAVDILLGRIPTGSDDVKLGLPWNAVRRILEAQDPIEREQFVRREVAQRLRRETYQQPDDIAKGLAIVGIKSIWKTAFDDAPAQILDVSLAVRRRNDIVHSCDVDPATLTLTPIIREDAKGVIETVERTARSIDALC